MLKQSEENRQSNTSDMLKRERDEYENVKGSCVARVPSLCLVLRRAEHSSPRQEQFA